MGGKAIDLDGLAVAKRRPPLTGGEQFDGFQRLMSETPVALRLALIAAPIFTKPIFTK